MAGCSLVTLKTPAPDAAATSAAPPAWRSLPVVGTIWSLLQRANDIMHYINDWDKATKILTRFMRGLLTGDRAEPPSSTELRAARSLQFLAASLAFTSALRQGNSSPWAP